MKFEIDIKNKMNCIFVITGGFILFILSCIDPFTPNIPRNSDLLVIDASIVKGQEKQIIKISLAASVTKPEYLPLQNCDVIVSDNSGGVFIFEEESMGVYVANIDDADLKYNTQYKLQITAPTGEIYESNYQTLLETPPVDSIYCAKELHYSSVTNSNTKEGIQFYVDIKAPNDASRYYRWKLVETWEIRAQFKIQGTYDGVNFHMFDEMTDSLYYCWDKGELHGFYSESTINLLENEKKEIPLYFLEKTGHEKLWIKYCVTVNQYALNEEAYEYWHQREIEINESDGIYTKQPYQLKSNIININNPDEQVLGFFWVSSCTKKHIFLRDPFDYSFYEPCPIHLILSHLYYGPYPIFIIGSPDEAYYAEQECFDCRLIGGVPQRPDFWE